ncbi:FAD-binding protein [Rhodococcus sp. BP-252]|uniref:FAD-binding oxidoreductase n=1 Tax=unclassified Rhodococcus (in: high G+C Gram-positive bacteria) TaxID=192944 RepID=UPI001C9AAEB2|nr:MULTISPECIES: FAD-linked oxidase C-terminal domain-containing protein [unclassified Rhodococcus (in: high G+C Gram-positive bacteria)]MBY6412822.1 FAD-binding protein [Rhodococcus sp. BP-320]MBY6417641.1 FAD-binding protein [Rhodococcus sp. BP-321]MBY6423493.1 FAD-binding protein [Rhodococcus sp. BP-324]MBY6427665.1 FAD-binding protein [Rhodococcus sp. BP-323]MBY6432829.1 FAD-binding protein [Rhodococcus sp. BP-322]
MTYVKAATSADLDRLRSALPDGVVVTDPSTIDGYRADSADLIRPGTPLALVRPRTVEEVSVVLRWATAHATPVVPRGAGTGLSGGAAALDGALIVSLEKMTAIREIDPLDQTVVVEAGVVNADVGRAAAPHGLFYPPDPGSFEVSTIGGNLATNAGGMRCVKYGVTRNSVLGLEVVLPDGRILHTGSRTVKNVAGLDLTHLFIGSEGGLGIITAATLRLRPLPVSTATFVASFADLGIGGEAMNAVFASGAAPSMFEIMDNATINAVEDYRRMDLDRSAELLVVGQTDGVDALAAGEAIVASLSAAGADVAVATDDPIESEMLVQARRLAGWATMEQGPSIIEDVGVPRARLAPLLGRIRTIAQDTGIRIATVGHAGDGNVHPILMLTDLSDDDERGRAEDAVERICAAALDLGGTITGEHGVGELKLPWLERQVGSTSLDIQHKIKEAIDPMSIMNPGRGI